MNTVEGLSGLLNKFATLGDGGTRMAKASVSAVADLIVAEAKESAPAAFGKIRQGIIKEQLEPLLFTVIATAPESAFQEFGTGGKVDVPAEMSDVAATFQGQKGGGMQAFIQSLIDWIQLRGLTNTYSVKTHRVSKKGTTDQNEQLAWAIAKKILRDGLMPQPFLYPAYLNNSVKLVPMLQTALEQLMRENQA